MSKLSGWEFYGEEENPAPSPIIVRVIITALIVVGLFGFFFS